MQFRIERINRSARNEFCTETQFNRLSIQPVVKFKFTFVYLYREVKRQTVEDTTILTSEESHVELIFKTYN